MLQNLSIYECPAIEPSHGAFSGLLLSKDVPCANSYPREVTLKENFVSAKSKLWSQAGVSHSFRITSYIPNIIAALGTVRNRCGVRPPYRATMPSSFKISLKHWIRLVYFGCPLLVGAKRRRVRTT
jgi:hypothetical protein